MCGELQVKAKTKLDIPWGLSEGMFDFSGLGRIKMVAIKKLLCKIILHFNYPVNRFLTFITSNYTIWWATFWLFDKITKISSTRKNDHLVIWTITCVDLIFLPPQNKNSIFFFSLLWHVFNKCSSQFQKIPSGAFLLQSWTTIWISKIMLCLFVTIFFSAQLDSFFCFYCL